MIDWFDLLALWIGRTILVLGGCLSATVVATYLLSVMGRRVSDLREERRKRRGASECGMERRLDVMGDLDRCWICGEGPHDNELCPRSRAAGRA